MKVEEKKSTLSASRFRLVLSMGVLLLAIGIGLAFSFGIQKLQTYAVEVSHKKVDAEASSGNIHTLQTLNQKLGDYKDVLDKAQSLKISSEFPEFAIVKEVKAVAAKNGIGISSYNLGNGSGDSSATTSSDTTGTTTTPSTPTAPSGGGNSISLTVNLSSPIDYKKLLQFLYDVEHHVPIMEVGGVSMTAGSSSGQVSVEAISIKMYVRA